MVPPTPKRMMWRVTNGNSLGKVAEIFVLLLCGVQLVLRYGVLTLLDLDEVDVAPSFVEVFRSELFKLGMLFPCKSLLQI